MVLVGMVGAVVVVVVLSIFPILLLSARMGHLRAMRW